MQASGIFEPAYSRNREEDSVSDKALAALLHLCHCAAKYIYASAFMLNNQGGFEYLKKLGSYRELVFRVFEILEKMANLLFLCVLRWE